MFILILDDGDTRHNIVERLLSKEHVVLHAFNADEAIEILKTCNKRVGLALLDHDLGDFVEEENGRKYERHGVYFLAKMFADLPEDKWPAQFILHSGNVVGVQNMLTDLRNRDQVVDAINFSGDMIKRLAERIKPQ